MVSLQEKVEGCHIWHGEWYSYFGFNPEPKDIRRILWWKYGELYHVEILVSYCLAIGLVVDQTMIEEPYHYIN